MLKPISTPDPGPGVAYGLGALTIAIGSTFSAMALGWIDFPLENLRAPREVLLYAGLIFALSGVLLASRGRLPKWVSGLVGAILFTAFALIPTWIAFGDGPRQFGGNAASLTQLLGLDGASVGRLAFGASALLLWLCALAAWWSWLASMPMAARALAALLLVAAAGWLGWGRFVEPAARDGESDHERLARYIAALHAAPDFKQSAAGGGRNAYLHSPEEGWIRLARARLAALREAPAGQSPQPIPAAARAPVIDGRFAEREWDEALRIAMTPETGGAALRLMHRDGTLFIAGEAPQDRTEAGFDQMRFHFHVEVSPAIRNERVFVNAKGSISALRTVRLGAGGTEATEWSVLAKVRGASAIQGHRRFELALDPGEAGLDSGAPFPAWFDIEGDPLRTAEGKFKARHIEGRAGSHAAPLWLRIAR